MPAPKRPNTTAATEAAAKAAVRRRHQAMVEELRAAGYTVGSPPRRCEVGRPADGPCDGPAAFDLVTRSSDGKAVRSREPGCLRHAMADADRAAAARSMARVDVETATEEPAAPAVSGG